MSEESDGMVQGRSASSDAHYCRSDDGKRQHTAQPIILLFFNYIYFVTKLIIIQARASICANAIIIILASTSYLSGTKFCGY